MLTDHEGSALDRYLTTDPRRELPEMDEDDELRLLLDVLESRWRKFYSATRFNTIAAFIRDEILENEVIADRLIEDHRQAIAERWAQECEDRRTYGDE